MRYVALWILSPKLEGQSENRNATVNSGVNLNKKHLAD